MMPSTGKLRSGKNNPATRTNCALKKSRYLNVTNIATLKQTLMAVHSLLRPRSVASANRYVTVMLERIREMKRQSHHP